MTEPDIKTKFDKVKTLLAELEREVHECREILKGDPLET